MHTFQRGFFCADLTLRHPYRECTITVPMLLVLMLLLPMLFIAVVEIMRICKNFRIRKYIRNLWQSEGTFSFGFIATYLTTELAKNAVGRLRPHFYTACQPRMPDGTTCADHNDQSITVGGGGGIGGGGLGGGVGNGDIGIAVGVGGSVYVEQYYCSNRNLTSRQIRELHVSFPSAHSSLSFYAMLFLAFYLHAVWKGRGTCRILRHILQFLFILLAWFISLSRVTDYWHHWSDVLAGGIMGVIYAIITASYIGGMLDKNYGGRNNSSCIGNNPRRVIRIHREQLMQCSGSGTGTGTEIRTGAGGVGNVDTSGVLVTGGNTENDWKLQAVMPS